MGEAGVSALGGHWGAAGAAIGFAGLSLVSMLPLIGDVVGKGGKAAVRIAKNVDETAAALVHLANGGESAASAVAKRAAPESVLTVATGPKPIGQIRLQGASALSAREATLLKQLSEPGASIVVPKKSVSMSTLRRLSAASEDQVEFAMLTRGNQRMIIGGG